MVQGQRRDIGLGGLRLVSLAEACEEVMRLLRLALDGEYPLAKRRARRRTVQSFEVLAREVHKAEAPTFRNAKHAAQWIGTLEKYAFPVFGPHRLNRIESGDLLKLLSPIWVERPETARQVRQRIRTVFDWAKAKNFRIGENSVEGTIEALPAR